MNKKKLSVIELRFDNEESANGFIAGWLDGGLDGGGNLDWNTDYKESDKWDKRRARWLRIKGTGYCIDNDGTVLTPEIEEARMKKFMKQYE